MGEVNMSYYENLEVGQHVVFHDERQQEVPGTVRERDDCGNHIRYVLDLDGGGTYVARLKKQGS